MFRPRLNSFAARRRPYKLFRSLPYRRLRPLPSNLACRTFFRSALLHFCLCPWLRRTLFRPPFASLGSPAASSSSIRLDTLLLPATFTATARSYLSRSCCGLCPLLFCKNGLLLFKLLIQQIAEMLIDNFWKLRKNVSVVFRQKLATEGASDVNALNQPTFVSSSSKQNVKTLRERSWRVVVLAFFDTCFPVSR